MLYVTWGTHASPTLFVPCSLTFCPLPSSLFSFVLFLFFSLSLIFSSCGDGSVLFHASSLYRCSTVGYELDESLVQQARERAEREGLTRCEFIIANFTNAGRSLSLAYLRLTLDSLCLLSSLC